MRGGRAQFFWAIAPNAPEEAAAPPKRRTAAAGRCFARPSKYGRGVLWLFTGPKRPTPGNANFFRAGPWRRRASLAGVAGGRRWRASLAGVAGGCRRRSRTKTAVISIKGTKTRHTHKPPKQTAHHSERRACASHHGRTQQRRHRRLTSTARVKSRSNGQGQSRCARARPALREAAKKERPDNDRPEDSKTYRTLPRSLQLRPSPHPPCASAEAATCR